MIRLLCHIAITIMFSVLIGMQAYQYGMVEGKLENEALHEDVNATMRKIGICDWARVMYDETECKRQRAYSNLHDPGNAEARSIESAPRHTK